MFASPMEMGIDLALYFCNRKTIINKKLSLIRDLVLLGEKYYFQANDFVYPKDLLEWFSEYDAVEILDQAGNRYLLKKKGVIVLLSGQMKENLSPGNFTYQMPTGKFISYQDSQNGIDPDFVLTTNHLWHALSNNSSVLVTVDGKEHEVHLHSNKIFLINGIRALSLSPFVSQEVKIEL